MVGAVAALSLAASVPPAAASVTIGQLAPGSPASAICGFQDTDIVQTTVTSGSTYVVPPYGATIVSWSTNASVETGQLYTLKVFRRLDTTNFMVVAHDGPRPLVGGTLNTFPVSIPVEPGDIIGLNFHQGLASSACEFVATSADIYYERTGNLADGSSAADFSTNNDFRVNVAAVVKPSNAFSLGELTRNKRKGTATLAVNVPGPGELTASGKGVKAASIGQAVISKSVPAGPAQLLIKAKGKKKKTLNETGKVKLNVAVTYTPTNGDPGTQSVKVKLKKKL